MTKSLFYYTVITKLYEVLLAEIDFSWIGLFFPMEHWKITHRINIQTIFTILAALPILTAGCRAPVDRYAPQIVTPPAVQTKTLGYSIQNRPIECIQFGHTGPTALVIGAIHGNEPASCVLADTLREYLISHRPCSLCQRILIIPVANPDGLAAGTRDNANQIDLNRNFPTDNRLNNEKFGLQPLSEPESQILYHLIETEKPARILTIHQPYGCIDFDGPGEMLARRITLWCPLPLRRIGALPGSLGTWAGETKGIPTITLELTAEDTALSNSQIWDKYGKALLDFITFP